MCGFTGIFVFDMLRIIVWNLHHIVRACVPKSYRQNEEVTFWSMKSRLAFFFSFLYEGDANKLALNDEKIEF